MSSSLPVELFEDAPLGIILLDQNLIVTYLNARAKPSFQENQVVIGSDFRKLMALQWSKETAQNIVDLFEVTLKTGEPVQVEEWSDERLDKKQREYYDWQVRQIKLENGQYGVICYFIDITKHVLARQAAEENTHLLHDLANDLPIIIWTADADGSIDFTNKVMSDLVGATEPVVGWQFLEYLHPDDKEKVARTWSQALISGKPYEDSSRLRAANGEYVWQMVRALPVRNHAGEIVKWAGSCTDIDQQKRFTGELEKRVDERTALLRDALQEAELASNVKSQFVSTVSHEIRTPMSAIIGLSEFLTTLPQNDEQKEISEHILRVSKGLLRILNDMLDFSRLDAGKMTIEHHSFDSHDLLKECTRLYELECQQKGIALSCEIAENVPATICGDEQKVRQLLTNFLSNAVKFTQNGFVKLSVDLAGQTENVDVLKFAVSDSGMGISAETQALLFEPFTQADNSMTRRFGGSGLGLSICKRYVDILGGEIGLNSEENQGSTFWFILTFKRRQEVKS